MFKPREMKRALIIGAKHDLGKTIEQLHSLGAIHIIDYIQPDDEECFGLGAPLENASEVSQQLFKLRSNARLLDINPEKTKTTVTISDSQIKKDLDLKIQDLGHNVLSVAEDRAQIEDTLRKINDHIVLMQPFVDFGIPMDFYRGYHHISVFTGRVRDLQKLKEALPGITEEYELFTADATESVIALFIVKTHAEQAEKLLVESGFTTVSLPEKPGMPSDFIEEWTKQKQELSEKLDTTITMLQQYQREYTEFILAGEEYLSIEVEKSEAPVRFATTPHSFVIDCWIPTHILQKTKESLEKETNGSLYIEEFPVAHDEEPPTLLENPKPVKRFEYLLDLYSIPNYRDIDPSIILALIFPLFFGFMVGDFGFGILLIIVGYLFVSKFKDSEGISNIGWYTLIAGIFSTVFGLFLFGDMFGMTFQNAPAEGVLTYSWSGLIGINIPIPSVIHKMEAFGLTELLVLSIIAGGLHIGLGLLLGVINERKHDRKHAITKIGLLCVLVSLVVLIFVMADYTWGRWLLPLKHTAVAPLLWGYLIPAVKAGVYFGELLIPYVSIILVVLGAIIILVSTGGFGLIEVLEVTSHLISYTRLAAICVAKGAMAFAFNVIGLGMILSGNIVFGILGFIVLVFLQMIVLALGSLSSGIQAVRLHYVEFFMKFYKGGGVKYNPFEYKRKYTTHE